MLGRSRNRLGESAAANVEKCMIDDDPRGPIALSPQKAGGGKGGEGGGGNNTEEEDSNDID